MSTPSEYIKAINKKSAHLKEFKSDFFPVIKEYGDVFSGYFSSRPGFKAHVRQESSLTHAQNKYFAELILKQDLDNSTES